MAVVPHYLERLILQGKATYRNYTHALGMFGTIQLPEGCIGIIVQICWYPFLNPIKNLLVVPKLTYNDFFKYNEYQLKIDTKKNKNYYTFRNALQFQNLNGGAFDLSADVDQAVLQKSFLVQTPSPIILDTYLVAEEYIKLTISRNAMLWKMAATNGLLATDANELPTPNGMQDIKTLLNENMFTPGGLGQDYKPPGYKDSGSGVIPTRMKEDYVQDFQGQDAFNYNSQLSDTQDIEMTNPNEMFLSPGVTTPLIGFGVVTINKNDFDRLMN